MNETDVVIVGAGPNGLLLARELALAGVRPVVLEQLSGPDRELKANAIVGQANRVLDMRGLYQELSGTDAEPQQMERFIFSGLPVPFDDVVANPMYGMMIQQPEVVRRLVDRVQEMGVEIRWGHGLVDLKQDTGGITVEVAAPTGTYRMPTTYLVGADGGRSQVRKKAGIGFGGLTTDVIARVAHVGLPGELRTGTGGIDVPGLGPIPFGHNRFDGGVLIYAEFQPGRSMVGTIEYGSVLPDDAPELTIDELAASVERVIGVRLPLTAPDWPGPHALRRINGQNTRQAEEYRLGNIFLVGDAAHVHSAMGGPGLNLGLQDAMNLGWKLAAAVTGRAPAGLLDSYHSERWPAGQRVMMHSMAQSALMASGPETSALRTLFGELIETRDGATHIAGLLSGSDVRYDVGSDHPLAGRLVPDLRLDDGRRVAELLHPGRAVLVDLAGGDHAAVVAGWTDRVDVVVATMAERPAAALLIRPDGYVAWAADGFQAADRNHLVTVLRRWFGEPSYASVALIDTVT